jgi:hypothetical protein
MTDGAVRRRSRKLSFGAGLSRETSCVDGPPARSSVRLCERRDGLLMAAGRAAGFEDLGAPGGASRAPSGFVSERAAEQGMRASAVGATARALQKADRSSRSVGTEQAGITASLSGIQAAPASH